MASVIQFQHIDDFVQKLKLGIRPKQSGFFVLKYEQIPYECFEDLEAYRQNYFEITLDVSQACNIQVDRFELPSQENRLTLVSPHRLQKILSQAISLHNCKGYSLFFSPQFLGTAPGNHEFSRDYPFFDHLNFPAIILERHEMAELYDLAGKIYYEYEQAGEWSADIIKSYLNILLLKAKQKYPIASPKAPIDRNQEIYNTFSHLVRDQFREHYTVRDYAGMMHISPKHLSETIKKVSGKSALQVIHTNRLHYAQALLQSTHKTVAEIAYELNFESPDYFSAFFKRLAGRSPVRFRLEKTNNTSERPLATY
ncbi:AraC family transcriptional regulator [Negadavirga shengliensis]|uniref:Helix-turn-helix transcriptional regulator n=1 Tax=Negadavirga shengliensis TaxID=1389218 RepID=A0ABV9T8J1_9BACT